MGAGSFPAGAGPAGSDPVYVPAAVAPLAPPRAVFYDPRLRQFVLTDANGIQIDVHPVDQMVALRGTTLEGQSASQKDLGTRLKTIVTTLSPPRIPQAARAEFERVYGDLIQAGDIKLLSVVPDLSTYGRAFFAVSYVNLRDRVNQTSRQFNWPDGGGTAIQPADVSIPFQPNLVPGLVLWLRSDVGITLNGSNVLQWADQSSSLLNVSQGAPANQPVYGASGGPGGKPHLDFVGANGTALASPSQNILPSGNLTTTVVLVANSTTGVGSATGYFQWGAINIILNSFGLCRGKRGTSVLSVEYGAPAGPISFGTLDTAPHIITVIKVPGGIDTTTSLWVDGVQRSISSSNTGTPNVTAPSQLFVGVDVSLGSLDGSFEELFVYNRALSLDERMTAERYAGARYGITVP